MLERAKARVLSGPRKRSQSVKINPLLSSVLERASEVIGDRQEALRWLGTPLRALEYATPISLLETPEGAARVTRVLGQMEHGVW